MSDDVRAIARARVTHCIVPISLLSSLYHCTMVIRVIRVIKIIRVIMVIFLFFTMMNILRKLKVALVKINFQYKFSSKSALSKKIGKNFLCF